MATHEDPIRAAAHAVAAACLVALAPALGGCGSGSDDRADVLALKIEVGALKQELEYLRVQTEELDPRVRSAEQMALTVLDEREAPFRLDCEHGRPGALPTRLAYLAAVCEDARPLAGGVRVLLKVGNPTSARLDGLRLTFYAGDGAARGRSEKRLYHEAAVSLNPGAWTVLAIDLAGVDQSTARNLAVRADVGMIALAAR
jgi:hypothetical protein